MFDKIIETEENHLEITLTSQQRKLVINLLTDMVNAHGKIAEDLEKKLAEANADNKEVSGYVYLADDLGKKLVLAIDALETLSGYEYVSDGHDHYADTTAKDCLVKIRG